MFSHVNTWLLALSFLLGLVLTLAFMIRRVKREVPVYGAPTADVVKGGAVQAAGLADDAERPRAAAEPEAAYSESKTEVIALPESGEAKTETIKLPDGGVAGAAGLVSAAASAGKGDEGDGADKVEVSEEPYGAGSFRLVAGGSVPTGWTIKGNEDSMLYHTTESPAYQRTLAEVWFRDVPTAEAAGFNRWDSGKSQRDKK